MQYDASVHIRKKMEYAYIKPNPNKKIDRIEEFKFPWRFEAKSVKMGLQTTYKENKYIT